MQDNGEQGIKTNSLKHKLLSSLQLWCSSVRRQHQIPITAGPYILFAISVFTLTVDKPCKWTPLNLYRAVSRFFGEFAAFAVLQKCDSCRSAQRVARSTSVCTTRRRATDLLSSEVRSHNSVTPRPPLVMSSEEISAPFFFQTGLFYFAALRLDSKKIKYNIK